MRYRPYLIFPFPSSLPTERARTDEWDGNILRYTNNALYRIYLAQRDTRFKFLIARSYPPKGAERRIFSFSFRTNPSNEIAASFHGTLSLPSSSFSPFSFSFSLSFFPFFKEKPQRTASETERGGGGGRKKQYAVGRSRGGVQTPASPISRLVVKHRALGRFRGAARLCRCFRPRRGFYTARIYTEQDEKADHLSSIEIRGQPTRGKRDRIVKLRVLALAALRSSSTMLARCTQDRASPEGDR